MTNFPSDFIWGTATSSYQIEGGAAEGGRGPSIWDSFCTIPGTISDASDGAEACDHYHRLEEDVALMQAMGAKAYRFSIAWPRIQPTGQGEPNQAGIDFYNRLIDCLIAHNITPWVTLYHWDMPLSLEQRENGWLNPAIAETFAAYARICFEAFGDRVKHWITLNEPWCSALLGYGSGEHAPGRTENMDNAYIAAHNLLRAHAYTVHVYRTDFADQSGQIGITNNCDWRDPATDTEADKAAAQRSVEFFLAWFADPIWKGDYPAVMRELVGDRLPQFSDADKKLLLGSSDFFGLNHYSTALAAEPGQSQGAVTKGNGGIFEDARVDLSRDPSWELSDMEWPVVPDGCRKLLQWIHERYDQPDIYITENGMAHQEQLIDDQPRVHFFKGYLKACEEAIESGVNLKGYFAWSLMDNFEWAFGYERRFGITHIDFGTFKRTPKSSYYYLQQVFKSNSLV